VTVYPLVSNPQRIATNADWEVLNSLTDHTVSNPQRIATNESLNPPIPVLRYSFKPSKDRYKQFFLLPVCSFFSWFQTLKGSLQTGGHSPAYSGDSKVSNPQRIATNSGETNIIGDWIMFQTLKGSLQTNREELHQLTDIQFQTLKGSLQTTWMT